MIDPAAQAAQTFRDEANELLSDLEEALLELEGNPSDMDCIGRVFRALHTIKGSGAMFGFEEIARFTHEVETLFDKVRNKEMALTREMLTLTLLAKDHISILLARDPAMRLESSDELLNQFRAVMSGSRAAGRTDADEPSGSGETQGPGEVAKGDHAPEVYWIRYLPIADTMAGGTHPLSLIKELQEQGGAHVVVHADAIPLLGDIVPENVYMWWDILLNSEFGENAIHDVFIFVEDDGGLDIKKLGDGKVRAADLANLAEVFQAKKHASFEELGLSLGDQFAQLVKHISTEKLKAQEAREKAAQAKADQVAPGASASIRVDSSRLDKLVNMVGELVIVQSRLSQVVRGHHDPVLSQIAEDLERLTDEMRDNALSIRMVPFGSTFSGFRRLVRDLSNSLVKEVNFVTEGKDTELDKTVIDKLKDPLMHILRNSIDHGLESAEDRVRLGKSEVGLVKLSARHSSGEVVIEVEDDGKGIDVERVRRKGVERGLIPPDAEIPDKEIFNLIFEPGFSTAQTVSNVSGRGVGMDVVRRSIDSLRGAVQVDSKAGKGTTITVRLPLTLAIIDGLLVRIANESFILPLATVEACQERFVTSEDLKELEAMEYMGRMTPCVSLRKMLRVPGKQPRYERIIIAGVDGAYVGLAVDQVVGRQQAVIKSLDETCKNVTWISGTTINGDGGISLILDVPQLVRYAVGKADKLERAKKARLGALAGAV